MLPNPWIKLIIAAITLTGIAIGRFPVIKSNRTTVALMGVALLVVLGQVSFDELPDYIDYHTLILLFSMMIINANLKLAGFFSIAGRWIMKIAHTPRTFLALEILTSGFLSALFLNDTICLMFTPFLISLLVNLKRNPLPYLIALATAANIGSTATLTGNPQNMIIGIASGISYLEFTKALLPAALLGLGSVWWIIIKMYPHEFNHDQFITVETDEQANQPLLIKTMVITVGLLFSFLLGIPVALASFLAASLLLFTRRHQPQTVFAEFDWSLLVFFSALFVISGSLETNGVTQHLINMEGLANNTNVWNLSAATLILSNLVSNVPAVLLLKPVAFTLANPQAGWLTIAAASTLAGNLTLLGSVANLIVAETAARWEIRISFWEYTKSGVLITLISMICGMTWLSYFVW
jgi:Na+/H+ antiporter NhaD/arsenite permease-like protein